MSWSHTGSVSTNSRIAPRRPLKTYEQSIAESYGRPNLKSIILTAYEHAGIDIDRLTRDEITTFDEFDITGRDATRELADLAEIGTNDLVVDVGSGVGGPVRTLTSEFGVVNRYVRR